MDFFERQAKARRNTKLLVVYFVLAVVALVTLTYFASVFIFAGAQLKSNHSHGNYDEIHFALWNFKVFIGALVGTLGVIICGSAYKTAQLSGGGSAVATTMGGRLVESNTTDLNERKLMNVVEEMAIASGIPVPQVYVLDNEEGINAFAAGHTTSDAAIGVTRGAITMLKRDELQGVIGHEFSHILNGDMKLNIHLLGIIFGIICIATIGRILLRARGGKDRNALPLFGLVLLILGGVGVFFGRLIQAAVSRQREFLADASSVQFTRNPLGLSVALQKIGRYSFGSRLESEHAADMCHMFFGNGIGDPTFNFFATHPPIDERIRAIDTTWDGKFPPIDKEQAEVIQRAAFSDLEKTRTTDVLGKILGTVILAEGETRKPPVIKTSSVMPNLGTPTPMHLRYAEELRDSLPENLKLAARESADATAMIYALLLNKDETARSRDLDELRRRIAPDIFTKVTLLLPEILPIATHTRLPLVNIALPALRRMTSDEFSKFSETLHWLVESDGQVDVFEFTLQKIVLRHLESQFGKTRKATIQYYSLKPLLPDCAVVLSALAYVGSDDSTQIKKSFDEGAPYIRAADGDVKLLPQSQCNFQQLDAALNRLDQAVPQIKKNLLEACVRVVGADGVIQEGEAELLRAVSDTIDCPMPPMIPMQAAV